MEDYKSEIRNSRLGCLGSSDAKILRQVCVMGCVPKSAYKRLAVCKGLIPHQDIPYTDAVRTGDEIEMAIFNNLKSTDDRWESNVRWESEKLSRPNVKLVSHPDFLLVDEENKTLFVYECKATRFGIDHTRNIYEEQLHIHYALAKEEAAKRGKGWKVRLFLCHYSTAGLDLSQSIEFDPSRMTIRPVRFSKGSGFDIAHAMDVVNEFLETFDTYYEGEEVEEQYLPAPVKAQFEEIATMLTEIKERENKVKEFKARLFDFMTDKEIKSIKSDMFSIVRVDSTMTTSFDTKKFLEDYRAEHPRMAKKLTDKYNKQTLRNGYVTIKTKDNK